MCDLTPQNIHKALAKVNGVPLAFVFGSTATGAAGSSSDVDLLIPGNAGLRQIAPALRGVADTLGREINPVCLSPTEWQHKLRLKDALISRVAAEPKLFWLKGNPDALEAMGR